MTQSNVIAGALVVAFFIFITTRGELDDYVELFVKKRPPPVEPKKASGFMKFMGKYGGDLWKAFDGEKGNFNLQETIIKTARVASGDYTALIPKKG